jgi:hypothetical protein
MTVRDLDSSNVEEQATHELWEAGRATVDQEMGVVREQGPCVDGEGPLLRQAGQASHEVGAVGSSRKRARRSMPRIITWWRTSGASRRG